MRFSIAGAAAFCALTTGVHVVAGGPEVNAVVQASDLAPPLRAILGVIWHAVTVVLLVATFILAVASRRPLPSAEVAIAAIFLGWAVLFVFYGVTMLGTLLIMPQWIVFLLIPALISAGWIWEREG
ncbi:MAG: hypothetical protein ACRBCL_13535 [Maritimibacter sp.]